MSVHNKKDLFSLLMGAMLACGLLSQEALAQSATRQISLPNQDYTESTQDLVVKVMGGYVNINRTWTYGKWYLNDAWADLVLVPDPMGGVLAVGRADRVYSKASGVGGSVYTFDENNFIKATGAGWQWYDRAGNTIDYNASGKMLGYADRNGVKVTMVRDANGRLVGIKDHFDRQVITIENDAAGFPKKVSDYSGRSVQYEWQSQVDVRGGGLKGLLTKVTDVRGNPWTYTYTNGYIETRTDPEGGQIKLTYMSFPNDNAGMTGTLATAGSSRGSEGSSKDTGVSAGSGAIPSVGTTKVTQPKTARVASFKDEVGSTTNYRIDYNRVKREYMVSMQLPGGANQVIRYDSGGRILQNTLGELDLTIDKIDANTERSKDARGLITTTVYNAARLPLKVIYPDGASETTTYDPIFNQKTSFTNALGVLSTWAYDGKGNITEWVEAKGLPEQRTTLYTYDQWGNLLSKTRGAGDGKQADAITEAFEYDNAGNLTKVTNGLGHSTRATYNARGLPLTLTNPLGHVTTRTYDAQGNLLSSANALNQTITSAYDGMGRRTRATSAAGRIQTTTYDKAGRVTETLAPGQSAGQGTRIQYDAAGRPTQTTSPGGLKSTSEYDTQGRLVKTTDPAGNASTYEYGAKGTALAGLFTAVNYPTYKETNGYDQRGRQTVINRQLGATTLTQHQAFDAAGQRISSSDPAGKTTLSQYDGLGRLTQTTDPVGGQTQQSWDAQDKLSALTDAKGNRHAFAYDKAGLLTQETRPLGGAIRYSHDAAGQLILRTDAGGNTRAYSYNAAGRMTAEVHKLNGTTDQSITYTHDADGQLTAYEQKDGAGQLISAATYTQDAQGRTAASSIQYGKTDGSGTLGFQIGQSFNPDGQLLSHTYPGGSTQSYSYNKGQLSQVTLPNGSAMTYGNYQWMVPGQISTPGATKTISYDVLQRPTSIHVKNQAGQTLASRLYQYDQAGNITQIDTDLGKTSYGYDQLDRLTEASPDTALQAMNLPQESYNYDAVGNRIASSHQAGTWVYNADNQLTQYPKTTPFSTLTALDTRVAYTAQGHTHKETNSQTTQTYGYNAAERLTQYTNTPQGQATPSVQAAYRYDPFGRRIAKRVTEGSTTTNTYFIYSEQGLMAEANEQGQMTSAYGFNPKAAQQGLWSTDPIWQAKVQGGSLTDAQTQFHHLHTDHLGTPMLSTDKDGKTSWKAVSEAFGAAGVLQNQSAITMNLRFPGQYWDEESQSHYNFFRDYRPGVGRYIQSDPIGLSDGVNIYNYAHLNPIFYFDMNGLQAGGWGPTGGPPTGRVNTIYCVNEILELYIVPVSRGGECPAIETCLRVHEDTHRKDAIRFDSKICKGLNNVAIGYYGENGKSVKTSSFIKDAEIRALENQIFCLESFRSSLMCREEWCLGWINFEIISRSNQLVMVLSGSYWD
ncbi:hypothetical protein CCO03_03825 [Comamonas serinivorans]|uniref:Teneurin-like YD-shell domain-containing protein n=1 Tax=Comamonas serinivorans TaxID=1082851 RepID=A0A1Y0EJV7_9BURK|nr:RHS repeat-associated core domain-containing protein [Comamonas serinivorans]ARU03923.1 hypothetical protein CCO03_03825 [Comamonas serinivorans]